jgi:hypothetical protein
MTGIGLGAVVNRGVSDWCRALKNVCGSATQRRIARLKVLAEVIVYNRCAVRDVFSVSSGCQDNGVLRLRLASAVHGGSSEDDGWGGACSASVSPGKEELPVFGRCSSITFQLGPTGVTN